MNLGKCQNKRRLVCHIVSTGALLLAVVIYTLNLNSVLSCDLHHRTGVGGLCDSYIQGSFGLYTTEKIGSLTMLLANIWIGLAFGLLGGWSFHRKTKASSAINTVVFLFLKAAILFIIASCFLNLVWTDNKRLAASFILWVLEGYVGFSIGILSFLLLIMFITVVLEAVFPLRKQVANRSFILCVICLMMLATPLSLWNHQVADKYYLARQIYNVGALSLLVSSIAFMTSFLPWKFKRHKYVCMSCKYDLTGNISGICPECGTTSEKSPKR